MGPKVRERERAHRYCQARGRGDAHTGAFKAERAERAQEAPEARPPTESAGSRGTGTGNGGHRGPSDIRAQERRAEGHRGPPSNATDTPPIKLIRTHTRHHGHTFRGRGARGERRRAKRGGRAPRKGGRPQRAEHHSAQTGALRGKGEWGRGERVGPPQSFGPSAIKGIMATHNRTPYGKARAANHRVGAQCLGRTIEGARPVAIRTQRAPNGHSRAQRATGIRERSERA